MVSRGGSRPIARLAVIFLLVWLALPAAALGTHEGEGVIDEVTVRLSYQPAAVAGVSGQLMAQLAMDDGSPIEGVPVEFLRETSFLGPRMINLGQATSDAYGTAVMPLANAEGAALQIVARFGGDEHYQAFEQTADIRVSATAARPASQPEAGGSGAPSLVVFATVMPPLLMLVAAGIWLLMFGLSARTVLAIRRDRPRRSIAKGEQS